MIFDFDAIAAALASHHVRTIPALPGRKNHLPAAVLLPLRRCGPRLELIAILRATELSTHPGEVGFAGGRPEAVDGGDLGRTALREAQEELGIRGARLLGRLSAMPLYTSDYRLFPFVAALEAAWDGGAPSAEVADVIVLDLEQWLTRPHLPAFTYRLDPTGPALASPLFFVRGQASDRELLMYGATAHVFYELLEVLATLGGRRPPPLLTGAWIWSEAQLRPIRRTSDPDPAP